jgi:hypothetical protein
MTNDEKERLCQRGLHMLDLGKSPKQTFAELIELIPQARRFTSTELEQLDKHIDKILEGTRRRWLNKKQAIYRFLEAVDIVANT